MKSINYNCLEKPFRNIGENAVKKHYEQQGYKAYKIRTGATIGNTGLPDFEITRDEERFFVEVKKMPDDLHNHQEIEIKKILQENIKVILAKYNPIQQTLSFYNLDENMGRRFLYKIGVKKK